MPANVEGGRHVYGSGNASLGTVGTQQIVLNDKTVDQKPAQSGHYST